MQPTLRIRHRLIVTRRGFLSLAGTVSLATIISACQKKPPENPPAEPSAPIKTPMSENTPTTLSPSQTPKPAGKITLTDGPADVWAWQVKARGQAENLTGCPIEIINASMRTPAALESNTFSAQLPLRPGENQVTAACMDSGITSSPITYTGRLRNVPTSVINISLGTGSIVLDGSASQPAPVDPQPIRDFLWSVRSGNPAEITIAAPESLAGKTLNGLINTPRLEIILPGEEGEYFLSLKVVDPDGRSDISTTYFTITGGKPVLADWATENTAWVENAIVYGVIPRKFGHPNASGIIERLDALQSLGVNALWLAPIHPSPSGDYGYAVMDYFRLREAFGTDMDFHRLVKEAHQRGIRVLMDFVPNHSSDQHPYFKDAAAHGPASHYWDFYDRDASGMPTHYFNWENLPNLNYNNPEVEQWMVEAFAYWVREFDVDGFRVDAAWAIRERKPDFWPRWRKALKRIKPDLLLLAEASARDSFYFTDGFDAAYDWNDQIGHWAWETVFKKPNLLVYSLNSAVTNNREGFHSDALIFRFLNNNDTSGRFLTVHGLPLTRVATVLLLTLPGIPCIYTGDEVGAEYTPYGDPQPLTWETDQHGMFAFHQQLIQLRRETPALHSRHWQTVTVEPHQQVFGFVRYTEGNDPAVLVLLNFLDKPASVDVTLPEGFASLAGASKLRDLLSGETLSIHKGLVFDMPPLSARILTL